MDKKPLSISCIVGLGNPGDAYSLTRHNCGFWFLDHLTSIIPSFQWKFEKKFLGHVGSQLYHDKKVYFLKPTTFMNLSGNSVLALLHYFKIDLQELLIIYDDMDLTVGSIKMKSSGSGGGHGGASHIFKTIGHNQVWRIKIGIDRPPSTNISVPDYVLGTPAKKEKEKISQAIAFASYELRDILKLPHSEHQKALIKMQQNLHSPI